MEHINKKCKLIRHNMLYNLCFGDIFKLLDDNGEKILDDVYLLTSEFVKIQGVVKFKCVRLRDGNIIHLPSLGQKVVKLDYKLEVWEHIKNCLV